jgi:DNA-binding NarL/FixJ family response regulator
MPQLVRVALVEDQPRLREALAAHIRATPGLSLVAAVGSAEAALRDIVAAAPDVTLLDIGLPGQSGLDALPALRQRAPHCAFIMLTVHLDEARVFQALSAGAVGYLLKDTPPGKLVAAIHDAVNGGAPMTAGIARTVVELFRRFTAPESAPQCLSARELEVLQHLADGYTYQNIAARLSISVETVRTYIRRTYDKLHVHTRSEAVARAIRTGLVR